MIRKRSDVWLVTFGITATTSTVAFPIIFWITSVEDRWHDIPISMGLTISMSIFFGWMMSRQVYKNFELAQQLSQLLEKDRLTDVATRDFFFMRMKEAPDAYGLSLMVDIDHFKSVNDTYGHLAGDAVIRHVAHILQSNCRKEDIVCRFGGEEFVVFLYGVGPANGYDAAERIRKVVEKAVTQHDEVDLRVTVSIGGSLKERTDQIDRAVKQADEALYKAKELGRNRSIMSWRQQGEPMKDAA
ncbi:GGDEF domain-containing protein [Tropicimonas sp. TH_r6]|uniref:GGDEF domain-containing protein n=1 Tax=Tropicimonas sp. TH_r6 TaxID=3082085 RepID=UPI002953D0A5|nr:GGDEF domain-containing protein [Tropicimonas sp. TH_r6]MDV7144184.1 GGDEF domain-containing protein [Tropicimonas sp. TH_r6]